MPCPHGCTEQVERLDAMDAYLLIEKVERIGGGLAGVPPE
jgi:hypothetical protein